MNITLVNSSRQKAWNDFVLNMEKGNLYHLFQWKDVFKKGYGLHDRYLAALRDGCICGILPLVKAPNITGRGSLVSLPYCDFAGPLADEKATEDQLIAHAQKIAEDERIPLVIRNLNAPLSHFKGNTENIIQKIAIGSSREEIMQGFSSNLRRKIRKARKNGIHIEFNNNLLSPFYKVYRKNMHRLGTPQHSIRFLRQILNYFPDNVQLVTARFENVWIGGMFIMKYKTVARDPWTSTLWEYNKLYTSNLLYFTAMVFALENNCRFFDFGRSQYESGTFNFKKQWGCEVEQLYYYTLQGGVEEVSGKTSSFQQQAAEIWKKLPRGFTNTIGGHVRKFLH